MSNALETVVLLLVAGPILGSITPLVVGLRRSRTGWPIAAVVCGALFAGSLALASGVYGAGERVVHQLGGFAQPIGIELVADEFSALIVVFVTAVSSAVLAYTRLGGPRGNTFYSGYLLLVGGLLGLSLTGDVFNMFVFLEIVGLATYALVASGRGGAAAVAALKYLVVGTVGASIYLLGVGFLFMATGTLNMTDLAATLAEVGYDQTLVRAGFAFVFVGFAIKVAQWPMHGWQPDAYQYAPDGVTPMIAALVSTVSAYALGRVLYTVFTPEFLLTTPYAREIVVTVGSLSVLAGSTLAVLQRDVKRTLAYSSVSQFGLIVAAYGLVTETAFVGAVIHLVGHGLLKAGLFVAAGVIALGYGARTVDEYAGLASKRPFVAGATAVLLIALIGIPPSVGFVGKWYIAVGAVESGLWPVAIVVFLSTMLTLAYAARLLEKSYFTPARDAGSSGAVATDGGETATVDAEDPTLERDDTSSVSMGMLVLLVGIAVLAVVLGFAGGTLFDLLEPFVENVFSGVSA